MAVIRKCSSCCNCNAHFGSPDLDTRKEDKSQRHLCESPLWISLQLVLINSAWPCEVCALRASWHVQHHIIKVLFIPETIGSDSGYDAEIANFRRPEAYLVPAYGTVI